MFFCSLTWKSEIFVEFNSLAPVLFLLFPQLSSSVLEHPSPYVSESCRFSTRADGKAETKRQLNCC